MAATGSMSQPGLDLDPHPGGAARHRLGHLLAQDPQVVARGDPHRRPDRERLEAGAYLQRVGQGAAGQAQLGVGHRHLEEGAQHAIDRGAAEELGDLGLHRQLPAAGLRRTA